MPKKRTFPVLMSARQTICGSLVILHADRRHIALQLEAAPGEGFEHPFELVLSRKDALRLVKEIKAAFAR